jgi:hypothetical protein
VLRPSAAAELLGLPTREIIRLMWEERVPRVRLADGTLGVPEAAVHALRRDGSASA